jgi:hypothetical protein
MSPGARSSGDGASGTDVVVVDAVAEAVATTPIEYVGKPELVIS